MTDRAVRPSSDHEMLKDIWDMLYAREAVIRLDEHSFYCLYCNQGAIGCDRGRELQQAAGGSAAAKRGE